MIREADFTTLWMSSCIAGLVSGSTTNVFDVIKTLMMNAGMNSPLVDGKVKQKVSYIAFVRNIGKEQGKSVYFRGIGYGAATSMARSGTLLPLYEFFQRSLLKLSTTTALSSITGIGYILPLLSGVIAKAVAQTVSFPFEYMATLRQANIGAANKSLKNGFGSYLLTGLAASAGFWSIHENVYGVFKKENLSDRNAYILSAFLSSIISSVVAYPFDLIKTWRISFPERFTSRSSLQVGRDIVQSHGWHALYSGLLPRIFRGTTGNTIFFMVYTRSVEVMRSNQKNTL